MTRLAYYKQKNPFEIENFVDNFFSGFPVNTERQSFSPSLDVQENDNDVIVTADLPGLNKKDINIEYKDSVLSISGEKIVERHDETNHYSERQSGKFSRSFEVGNINFDQSKASYENGVLNITLPKSEEQKSKYIQIK